MKTLRTILIIVFLSGILLTGCKKAETVEPTKTEYCDIRCYNKAIHNFIITYNNIFIGTETEIEYTKTQSIQLLLAQGNTNITISNCTDKKHCP